MNTPLKLSSFAQGPFVLMKSLKLYYISVYFTILHLYDTSVRCTISGCNKKVKANLLEGERKKIRVLTEHFLEITTGRRSRAVHIQPRTFQFTPKRSARTTQRNATNIEHSFREKNKKRKQ